MFEGKKDFDGWNKLKKKIELRDHVFCNRREIWWCSIGDNIGSETCGKNQLFERPVLIIKVFNHQSVLVVPITSRPKNDLFHEEIILSEGLKWCILSHVKTISSKRLIRKFDLITETEFNKIVNAYISLILNTKRNPALQSGESRMLI